VRLIWRDVELVAGKPALFTSLTESETKELQKLATLGDALEIGSAYGYSAIAMALVGARVTAVDPHGTHQSMRDMILNLDAFGVSSQVRMLVDTSQAVLPRLVDEAVRFDVIFIDGDHTHLGVRHDIFWATQLLRERGVIACHDYHEETCPGVAPAIDEWRVPDYVIDTLAVFA
jgi:predicted O-methyltransferase YrrM